jgi:hypothetical protein
MHMTLLGLVAFLAATTGVQSSLGPSTAVEPMLYHAHIPKTGGRSFLTVIMRLGATPCLPGDKGAMEAGQYHQQLLRLIQTAEGAAVFIEGVDAAECNLVSLEQHVSLGRAFASGTAVRAVSMLREPIEHALSMVEHDYNHGRNKGLEDRLTEAGELRAAAAGNYNLTSPQVQYLGDGSYAKAVRAIHGELGLADGAAGDLAFFGLTEYYHESMCLYQWVFRGTRVVSGLAGTDMAAACDCAKSAGRRRLQKRGGRGGGRGGRMRRPRPAGNGTAAVLDEHRGTSKVSQLPGMSTVAFKGLAGHVREDIALYAKALELFVRRVRLMEKDVGYRVLCSLGE